MGFFSALLGNPDDVPDTVGKDRAERLKAEGAKRPWFSKEATDARIKGTEQHQKRLWS